MYVYVEGEAARQTNSSGAAPRGARRDEGSAARVQTHTLMGEQLDFLIEHAESGCSGCSFCGRYGHRRGLLLEIFRDQSLRRILGLDPSLTRGYSNRTLSRTWLRKRFGAIPPIPGDQRSRVP